jgi:hypothetical protein
MSRMKMREKKLGLEAEESQWPGRGVWGSPALGSPKWSPTCVAQHGQTTAAPAKPPSTSTFRSVETGLTRREVPELGELVNGATAGREQSWIEFLCIRTLYLLSHLILSNLQKSH